MSWFYLIAAGIFEIGFAVALRYTQGFSKLGPLAVCFGIGLLSFYLLSTSLKTLPLGTAYAVWTGIGAVGTALIGIFYFSEPRDAPRLICISVIIVGIIGLKLTSPD